MALNKFRTPIGGFAFTVDPRLPANVRRMAETDIHAILSTYTGALLTGHRDELLSALSVFTHYTIERTADEMRTGQHTCDMNENLRRAYGDSQPVKESDEVAKAQNETCKSCGAQDSKLAGFACVKCGYKDSNT